MKNTRLMSLLLMLALILNACNTTGKSEGDQTAVVESDSSDSDQTFEELETTTPDVSTASTEQGIQFTDATWKDHLAKAKSEKKIIFLDAYASWCGPCKLLQKNVFPQKEVGDFFNKEFINVKIDMEKGEGPALALQYPLEAYPTLFFIDSDGKVIKKVIGYQSPEGLLAIGKGVKGEAAL